ncbi:ShlB/FhaC/HecB family hemolysin secretion/activation protein [Cognatilysobacter lacus]|uniref:ShlB/FhaC/HecB family hemolysin secretion/activation protein n=1 Tax=Cognatilysobacter lacus TaxID=1643323 RepID=A0A5D8ZBC6_9GAMM|nr:ShlB/FhaC/HecB family hemolysin secretion/activation protein [Lysobacter lacus]TZF89994.1 ShlB/FhaC/HecB family hemolysin secretion/activation protein [Lysobacter lacus]
MNKTKQLLPLMLLALSEGVMAQQIPGAGSQLRQLPATPVRPQSAPDIRIQEAAPAAAPDANSVRVMVRELRITGARAYPPDQLLAIAGFTPGAELTLADLQAMAARITAHYRQHGYFVALAYLPAQSITNNVVTLAVSEGAYGQVDLRNHSHLSDGLANGLLGGLNSGDAIRIRPLEDRLLLLSDLPGVNVTSTLVPGSQPGTSDLIVDVAPGRAVTGSIDADNAGNPYTGEYRLGGTINLNNPLGRGDVASLRLITSGNGLRYGRASYQMQFGRATAGVAYSKLDYELGKQFAPLHAHGSADVASVYGIYPLIRSRDSNLYAGVTYDRRDFTDIVDLVQSRTDRTANVWTGSLYGNHRDSFGGGGLGTFFLGLSSGALDLRPSSAAALDAVTARSAGSYSKLALNVTRLQRVTDRVSLYGSVSAQRASKNLDPSEKFVLGGMDGVRAYPQGEAFGDEGYLATLEARVLLNGPRTRVPGQVHLLGFVDTGSVTINRNPWFAGDNTRSLSAAGVGLSWVDPGNFAIRTYYARKLGSEDAISAPDRSGRFWIQAIKFF